MSAAIRSKNRRYRENDVQDPNRTWTPILVALGHSSAPEGVSCRIELPINPKLLKGRLTRRLLIIFFSLSERNYQMTAHGPSATSPVDPPKSAFGC